MRIDIVTIFPRMLDGFLGESMMKRAVEKGAVEFRAIDLREFTTDRHKTTDDRPFGGGPGMVMKPDPIFKAVESVRTDRTKVILMTPQGRPFKQSIARELSKEEHLLILCGHYEGIDERVLEEIVTDYVSIGDYVLTGGELPAMVMIDTISRLVPGVLHNDVSAEFESFQDNLLEYPQYSRPEEWRGKKVPPILLSGHHANIEKWRREQSILRTMERRPDLLKESNLTDKEKKWIRQVKRERKEAEKMKRRKGKSASLFGSNPNEGDGLAFQKKVRAEWKH